MPTTDHGILYPNSASSTNLWEHFQGVADSVETAFDTYETWTSWTPSWDTSGGGGFTSVGGSGANQGFYSRIGTLIHAEFRIELASGFAVDSGTFVLFLPVTAYAWGGSLIQASVGRWTARNDSDPYHYAGTLGIWDSDHDSVSFGGSWDGSVPRSRVDSNDPIVWASGDVLSGVLDYRAAS